MYLSSGNRLLGFSSAVSIACHAEDFDDVRLKLQATDGKKVQTFRTEISKFSTNTSAFCSNSRDCPAGAFTCGGIPHVLSFHQNRKSQIVTG
jgi:hypothetical protein